MGGDTRYYFAPPADPLNPHVTKSQIDVRSTCSAAPTRAMFDERGFAYFIREVYDAFYPGYGDSWPTFQGSIGMTYEQASARGLPLRADRRRRCSRIATASCTTSPPRSSPRSTAAQNRERLLRDFLDYRRSAVAEGEKGPVREYVLVPGHDPSRADLLARNLATQGIEVRRADEPFTRRHRARCPPAPTWSRTRSRPGACCATCSIREIAAARGVHQGAGSRAAASGWAIRSTTSPRGACRWCSTSRS